MCAARKLKCGYFSFTDEIKFEARARGMPESEQNRDSLTRLVAEMRRQEGAAVLAKRIAARIRAERTDVCVIEAIRHPAEIALLRAEFGQDFTLAAVVADVCAMAQRLVTRARRDESPTARASLQEATRLIERELRGADGAPVDVGRCIEMADMVIENNGTFEDLRRAVVARVGKLVASVRPVA
jgi:dephospho-CoA kinase